MESLLACKKDPDMSDLLNCKKDAGDCFGAADLSDLIQEMKVTEQNVKKINPDDKTFKLSEEYKYLDLYKEFSEDPNLPDADGMPSIQPYAVQTLTRYMGALSECMKNQAKFVDPEFPPEQKSLEGDGSNHYSKDWVQGKRPITLWKRPDNFYGQGQYKLFFDKIEPLDIKQGNIGNCYFMAALAAIAENPSRVTRLFVSRDVNQYGCYCIMFCHEGLWRELLIDDKVPCYADNQKPAFAQGNQNEIWVLLLEKAWAKFYGAYANIEGGWGREVYNELTGAPCTAYPTDYKGLFAEILKGEKFNWIMSTASNPGSGNHDNKTKTGISNNHLYSLLGGYEVQTANGVVQLVKLRNPWGRGEWLGEWSDNWKGWTPELRKQLGFQGGDDGIFFMPFADYCKEFCKSEICMYFDNYKFTCLKTKSGFNETCLYKVSITKPGDYFFIVVQKSRRKMGTKAGYTYSQVGINAAKIGAGGQLEATKVYKNPNKEAFIDNWTYGHDLPVGEYIVGVNIKWYDQKARSFVFKVYGVEFVELGRVRASRFPNFQC